MSKEIELKQKKSIPFPDKKYKTILADPPWTYENVKTGGSLKSGSAQKYPTMTLKEICNLEVPKISAKKSVLFLWATVPLIREGLTVMEKWGYEYKTFITWRKIMSLGMGYWFRGQVEINLLGIRGKVKAFRSQKPNFIQCKVGKHSQKPEKFFQLIEPIITKFDLNPKIELFAREKRENWEAWGLEVPTTEQRRLQRELSITIEDAEKVYSDIIELAKKKVEE